MRRIETAVCLVLCLGFSLTALAQERKITRKDLPASVVAAFEKAYPKATIKGLSTEKEDGKIIYEVESLEGTTSRDLLYLADGTVVEIEEGVVPADLPDPVKEAITLKYPKGKIEKAEKTTRGSVVSYEVKIKSGKKSIGVAYDPFGKLLKDESAETRKEGKKEKAEKEDND